MVGAIPIFRRVGHVRERWHHVAHASGRIARGGSASAIVAALELEHDDAVLRLVVGDEVDRRGEEARPRCDDALSDDGDEALGGAGDERQLGELLLSAAPADRMGFLERRCVRAASRLAGRTASNCLFPCPVAGTRLGRQRAARPA